MAISSPDSEFTACLQSEGTIIFLDRWYPSQKDLDVYPHIDMTSRQHWNPQQIQFPQTKYGVQEEIEGRNVLTTSIWFSGGAPREVGDNLVANRWEEVIVHDMNEFNRRMISGISVTEEGALKTNIWGKKRKREIASVSKVIDRDDQKKI